MKKNGVVEHYYDNGQLEEKGNYMNGKKEGVWKIYYDNGKLGIKETWKNGK